MKMFRIAEKKVSPFIQNSSIIIVNFPREAKVKFLRREFTSGLNSLALLLSGVDRAKGILGWKLAHGLSVP